MLVEYGFLFIFVLVGIILSVILFFISYTLIQKQFDLEKLSAYECGFDPFSDARDRFDVRFYLVSILFIIFDLEVTFLFPWSLVIFSLDVFGYLTMIIFLTVLTIGFVYEWLKEALEWE